MIPSLMRPSTQPPSMCFYIDVQDASTTRGTEAGEEACMQFALLSAALLPLC